MSFAKCKCQDDQTCTWDVDEKKGTSSQDHIFRELINQRQQLLMVEKHLLGLMLAGLVAKQVILRALIYGPVVKHSNDLRLFAMFYAQDCIQPLQEQLM